MIVIRTDLWLCDDCTIVAVNDDPTGIDDDARVAQVYAGLAKLGPHLVPDDHDPEECDDEDYDHGRRDFSWHGCDCCGSRLGGSLTRFAILGDGHPADDEKLQEWIYAHMNEAWCVQCHEESGVCEHDWSA